ncbi:MAG TPA: CHAT domain-containing tetratricopeptide repeat protein [Steroidobacteraceae bacterium]|nr:CHAT domain-containing tetratricopeptide repeat protein [Steroidobacteraceae bacterium]
MSVRDHLATYRRKTPRLRAHGLFAVAGVLCASACSDGSRNDLLPEYAAELIVTGDPAPAMSRTLQRGDYLIEARELEIDVHLTVTADGARTELEDNVPRHGTIYQVVSLSKPATLELQLRSTDHPTKRGRVALRIARWSAASDDRANQRKLGFLAFGQAGEQIALATPESATRAADKLYEGVTHFEAADDDPMRAQAAYSLAYVQYVPRDQWVATVRATEIAMEAYKAAGDEAGVHNASTLRAAAEIELAGAMNAGTQRAEQRALYAGADRRLADAAEYFASHGLPVRAQYAINMRAVLAASTADYTAATTLLARSTEMARANGDVAEEARSLGNLAAIHNFLGLIAQAAREYEELLPLIDPRTQPYQYATLLGNYGFTLIALGDFDRALTLHTEALRVYTEIGSQGERAIEMGALGGLYLRMGDAERALQTLRAAIVEHERLADNGRLAGTLRLAANAASMLGQHETAIGYLRKSAQIDANVHSVARTRVLVAAELRAAGNLVEAEAELPEPQEVSNALVRAAVLEERAHMRLAQNRTDAAIEDLREADRQYVALGLEFNRIDTNTTLSQALLGKRDVPGATAAADEAIAILTRIRVKSANPEWRARFLSARYAPYEARIAADLASRDAGAVWRTFRTAEEVRARSLGDELAHVAAGTIRISDPQEEELRARLTSQQLRLEARIQRQDADDSGTLALRHSIEETRAQLDAARIRLGGVAAQQTLLPDSLVQLQRMLPPDTAVLAYFVGDRSSHAWLLTRRDLRHATLAGRGRLQLAIEAAVAARRGRTAGERNLASLLLGNLLDGITEARMLVLADGPLNGVPFASLPVPGAGGELLIDRFVLSYAPSLALAMEKAPAARSRNTRVAVVSDPVYASDDRRLSVSRGAESGTLRSVLRPSPNNLTRLPYSALEASAVAKAFGSEDTIQLSGFEATAAQVLKLPSSELAVLHFATHAVARRDSPEQSALYLSEYTPEGTLLPASRLTATDITRSGLRADVVVLSGCATGDGSALRGEGVLGLTYGFLANGSRSVVATLWPIEDASTARFMREFYDAYRKSGRAADALRIAQLRTRGSAATTVWSSFVVRANEFP